MKIRTIYAFQLIYCLPKSIRGKTTRIVGDDTRGVGDDTRCIGDDIRGIGDDTRGIGDDTRGVASMILELRASRCEKR